MRSPESGPDHPSSATSPNTVQTTRVLAGRYELGPMLGRGGTAAVFRARDRASGDEVAVKLFGQSVVGPDERRREQEIGALEQLDHPGLVSLRDVGTDEGRAYLVMQLVAGPTLSERLERGLLSPEAVARVGAALADALAYVHAHGVVHRDVKPANVLLEGGERPLLTDFGIARLVDTTRVTATGYLVGTAGYLSPEQVRGDSVGPAADVYALGLVLLECVTGRQEYPGGALEAAVARLHRAPVVPPNVPAGLSRLLAAMTAMDPAARPAARAVAAELHPAPLDPAATALIGTSPAETVAAGSVAAESGRNRRRGTLVLAGAAAAAVLTAAGFGTVAVLGDGASPPGRSNLPPAAPVEPAEGLRDAPEVPVQQPTERDEEGAPVPRSRPTPSSEPEPETNVPSASDTPDPSSSPTASSEPSSAPSSEPPGHSDSEGPGQGGDEAPGNSGPGHGQPGQGRPDEPGQSGQDGLGLP